MNLIARSFLFIGLTLICTVFAAAKLDCKIRKESFEVCKESNVIVSIKELNNRNDSETIFTKSLLILDREVSSIAPDAFKNLSITVLMIDLTKRNLNLFPESFNGLPKLRSLQFHSGIVDIKKDLFRAIPTVSSLGLIVDITKVTLRGSLEHLPNLTRLKISESNLGVIKTDMFDNFHVGISYLTLARNNISRIEKKAFAPLKNLKSLQIYSNDLQSLQPGTFDGLDKLEILEIGWERLESIPRNLFNGLNRLEKLSLIWNRITIIDVDAFSGLNIMDLSLDNNDLNNLKPGTFNGLKNLSRLDLQYNNISYIPENVFNDLEKLTDLNFIDNKINKIETESFSGLDLWLLDLRNNNLTNITTGYFQGATIEELDLSNNKIIKIEKSAFKRNEIKSLNLMNNPITLNKDAWGLSESTNVICSA